MHPRRLIFIEQSVDLTRLPIPTETTVKNQSQTVATTVEYSAREVCPPALLLQQIVRAHQVFLLHQSSSVAELYARVGRSKMCSLLKRFWDAFIWSWGVLLRGNPAVDIFNGLKLASGGELGIGVGEEDWGSGEREVLEGFIGRTDGLVDLIVARFGDSPSGTSTTSPMMTNLQDLNSDSPVFGGRVLGPADGIIFSGIGALSRASVRNVSSWMEWLYMYGKDCYGVRDNPSSAPRRKRRNHQSYSQECKPFSLEPQRQQLHSNTVSTYGQSSGDPSDQVTGIPASILTPRGVRDLTDRQSPGAKKAISRSGEQRTTNIRPQESAYGTETMVKYLTLGVYGSSWGIPSGRPPVDQRISSLREEDSSQNKQPKSLEKTKMEPESELSDGYFLIGLQGQLDEDLHVSEEEKETAAVGDEEDVSRDETVLKNRIIMRTLHVERLKSRTEDSDSSHADEVHHDRLRVVVYVKHPFMFTFLFELQTDALAMPTFYQSLHHQLGPLQRPLLTRTSPKKVSERLWEAASPKSTASTKSSQPICDLVYDPAKLTVHTTIPNIPEPGPSPSETQEVLPWTRVEALSVHSQILNTYSSTRRHVAEQERTSKTSRQWWVVWMRLPPTTPAAGGVAGSDAFREAFLIRKASDYVPPAARRSSGRFSREVSGSSAGGGWGPGKLAEGIGIDARQYIEGLLSLNR